MTSLALGCVALPVRQAWGLARELEEEAGAEPADLRSLDRSAFGMMAQSLLMPFLLPLVWLWRVLDYEGLLVLWADRWDPPILTTPRIEGVTARGWDCTCTSFIEVSLHLYTISKGAVVISCIYTPFMEVVPTPLLQYCHN